MTFEAQDANMLTGTFDAPDWFLFTVAAALIVCAVLAIGRWWKLTPAKRQAERAESDRWTQSDEGQW